MPLTAARSNVTAPPAGPAQSNWLWFDGELVPASSAHTPLTAHGLHYGSGVFEGIRSYATARGAAVFRLPEHLQRMQAGARVLGLDFDIAQATDAVLQVLRGNRNRDAYIRPLLWAGSGSLGLDIAATGQHLMVASMPANLHLGGAGIRLGVTGWRRNPASSLPPLKLCGGYVNSILAKRDAKGRGFDEALFVDDQQRVVECTGANVFLVHAGRVTAVEHPDALAGITRATLIELAGAQSRPVAYQELLDADEVFVCGTAAEATAIAALEARDYGDNPVTRELQALYARVVRGEETGHRHWLTDV